MNLQRQHQAFGHHPEQGVFGDCWRTAVACVLRIERDLVPHAQRALDDPVEWAKWTEKVLRGLGIRQVDMPFTGPEGVELPAMIEWAWGIGGGRPFILSGLSPRKVNHSVAVLGPRDVHDPSPGGGGLIAPCEPDGYYWASFLFSLEDPQAVAQRAVAKSRFCDLL